MNRVAAWLGLAERSEPGIETGPVIPARDAQIWPALNRAVGLPAVYRAITLLATAVSQLGVTVTRGVTVLPEPSIIRRPDIRMSRAAFFKRTTTNLAGLGNSWWEVLTDPDGRPLNVAVLNAAAVSPVTNTTTGAVEAWRYNEAGRSREIPAGRVKHLRLLDMPGSLVGLGPIQACRATVAGALDLRDYSAEWFTAGSVPTGVLSTDQNLTPADADQARARWRQTLAGGRDVAVLGKGLTYDPVILTPADAQFLESQAFTVTDIARMFGIPSVHMLATVEGNSMTYANITDSDTHFVRYTLMAYLSEIEQALTELLAGAQTVRFDLSGLLRPDPKTLADVHTAYLAAGAITIEEVREDLGRPATKPAPAPIEEPANA